MIRIFRHTTYGFRNFGPEFDQVFSVSFTHALSEAATFTAEVPLPVGGLLSGPRFATLVVDDVVIATGEIFGYPIGVAGDTVTIEVICRHPEHSARVDALYAAIPVSARLADTQSARRSEPYVPSDVYHPPLTGLPELVRIGGVTKAGFEILGEGYNAPQHPILDGPDLEMTDSPLRSLTLTVSSTHNEIKRRSLDFGTAIGEQDTLTPDEYRRAVESINITGSNFEMLSVSVEERFVFDRPAELVTVRRPRIDPVSQLKVGRKDVMLEGAGFDAPSIPTIVTVEQPRREDLVLTVTADVLPNFGGARSEKEQVGLANPELSMTSEATFWRAGRGADHPGYIRRYEQVAASFFKEAGDESTLVMRNLVDYAAAKLLRAAHCVRVDVTVPAATAKLLTPKDRITIRDIRMDGGYVTGQVVGVEWSEREGSSEGRIELRVPCGTGGTEYATPASVVINGSIPTTPTLTALTSFNEEYFVEGIEIEGTWDDQVEVIQTINERNQVMKPWNEIRYESETIQSVRDYLPKPQISIGFRQVGAGSDTIYANLSSSFTVKVPRGIA